jgi:hypothetical protein
LVTEKPVVVGYFFFEGGGSLLCSVFGIVFWRTILFEFCYTSTCVLPQTSDKDDTRKAPSRNYGKQLNFKTNATLKKKVYIINGVVTVIIANNKRYENFLEQIRQKLLCLVCVSPEKDRFFCSDFSIRGLYFFFGVAFFGFTAVFGRGALGFLVRTL